MRFGARGRAGRGGARALAGCVAVALALSGCRGLFDEDPSVMRDRGQRLWPPDAGAQVAGPDAGGGGVVWLVPNTILVGEEPVTLPPRTSPPACPGPGSAAFCADCYAWTDHGPDSLGRNLAGDGFGNVGSGDFNGDGYPDLAVGAPGTDEDGADAGAVFLYLGSATGFLPWRRLRDSTHSTVGLGRAVAVGVLDGHVGVLTSYAGPHAGIVFFAGDGTGGFSQFGPLDSSMLLGPDGLPLVSADFGTSLLIADVTGSGHNSILVGAPDWSGDSGGVLMFGDASGWLSVASTGGTPATDRFGEALGVSYGGGGGPPMLVVGAPGSSTVHAFVWSSVTRTMGFLGAFSSPSGNPGFGRTIAVGNRGAAIGGSTGAIDAVIADAWRALSLGTGSARVFGVGDLDGDGRQEILGALDVAAPAISPLEILFGVADDPSITPALVTLAPTPPREPGDHPTLMADDWDGDGRPDIAIGAAAPGATAAAGQVFGYRGTAGLGASYFDPGLLPAGPGDGGLRSLLRPLPARRQLLPRRDLPLAGLRATHRLRGRLARHRRRSGLAARGLRRPQHGRRRRLLEHLRPGALSHRRARRRGRRARG